MPDPYAKELEGLIDEVRLLWNSLVRFGERLHRQESITMGMRAVLEFLSRNGSTTVPNIARRRRVTRQHIQALINPLLEEGLVEAAENPDHRRSALMRLTRKGEHTILRMRQREGAALRAMELQPSAAELGRSADVLRSVRKALDP